VLPVLDVMAVMPVLFVQAVLPGVLVTAVVPVALVMSTGSAFGVFGVFGEDVVEYAADRQAYRRDRRMGTHCPVPFMKLSGGEPEIRSRRVCRW